MSGPDASESAPSGPAHTPPPATVDDLAAAILAGRYAPAPADLTVTSAFWIHHTTRLAGSQTTYRNFYLLLRVGHVFGACSFDEGRMGPEFCASASGQPLDSLITDAEHPVRIAAMDAYLGQLRPHPQAAGVEPVTLPAGPPEVRARARDDAIAELLDIEPGAKVALIGVVNPLVAAIRDRGGIPLPCDFHLDRTQWGDPVTRDMYEVLEPADAVVATAMTLSTGTFDPIVEHCRRTGRPLIVYAQTGSALAREFLGSGITALVAEPFPFSQFSAEETRVYRYRGPTP